MAIRVRALGLEMKILIMSLFDSCAAVGAVVRLMAIYGRDRYYLYTGSRLLNGTFLFDSLYLLL